MPLKVPNLKKSHGILCIFFIQIVFVCEIGKFLLFFIPI